MEEIYWARRQRVIETETEKREKTGGMRMDKKTRFVIMVSHAVSEVDFLSYYHSRWIYCVGITIGLRFS